MTKGIIRTFTPYVITGDGKKIMSKTTYTNVQEAREGALMMDYMMRERENIAVCECDVEVKEEEVIWKDWWDED